jgi:hypothetical protein
MCKLEVLKRTVHTRKFGTMLLAGPLHECPTAFAQQVEVQQEFCLFKGVLDFLGSQMAVNHFRFPDVEIVTARASPWQTERQISVQFKPYCCARHT